MGGLRLSASLSMEEWLRLWPRHLIMLEKSSRVLVIRMRGNKSNMIVGKLYYRPVTAPQNGVYLSMMNVPVVMPIATYM